MTSRSGVVRKFTYSTERRRIMAREERWCERHWTPTGAEPTEQWTDGYVGLDGTLSLYGQMHMLSCVCKSARACVYVWFVYVAYVYIIYYNRPTILLTQKNLSFLTCSINNTVKLFS